MKCEQLNRQFKNAFRVGRMSDHNARGRLSRQLAGERFKPTFRAGGKAWNDQQKFARATIRTYELSYVLLRQVVRQKCPRKPAQRTPLVIELSSRDRQQI